MFLDLHEGILCIFADAQECARLTNEARLDGWLAYHRCRDRTRQIRNSRACVKRTQKRLRAFRRAAPVWQPTKPAITCASCDRCGAAVEFRQGCRAPIVHRCTAARASQGNNGGE